MPARIPDDSPNIEEVGNAATNGASDNTETFQSDAILDDVVISGVSCRLPESDNIEEFRQHLINKDDMVTDDERRWPQGTEFVIVQKKALQKVTAFIFQFTLQYSETL
jgi:hypothetical protein